MSRFCERIAAGKSGFLFVPSPQLVHALTPSLRRMLEQRYDGSVEELLLYSQSLELLVRAIDRAADGGNVKRPRRSDRERLFAAREFLETRLTDPPVLAESRARSA